MCCQEKYYVINLPQDASPCTSSLLILIDRLCQKTHYCFSASASNTEGKSEASDVIHCVTLGDHEMVVPGE